MISEIHVANVNQLSFKDMKELLGEETLDLEHQLKVQIKNSFI